jgi:photosystem II stability/assembly factor-like uncharacterized protein
MQLPKFRVSIVVLIFASIVSINANAQWIISDPFDGWYLTASTFLGSDYFVGTGNGKIFVTHNNGLTWTNLNVPSTQLISSLTTVGNNIFAGTEGSGVLKSTDNGASWTQVNNGFSNLFVSALINVNGKLLAATEWCYACGDGGVFQSSDNGASWTSVNTGIGKSSIFSFTVLGNDIFGASNGVGVFRTVDNGNSWALVNSGLNVSVHKLLTSGGNLFAATEKGAYRSIDSGNSWTSINKGLSDEYDSLLAVRSIAASGNYLFAGTLDGIYLSTNNGKSWAGVSAQNIAGFYLFICNNSLFASITDFSIPANQLYNQPLMDFPTITSVIPSAAITGSTITIKGTGFSSNLNSNTISIGGQFTWPVTASADSLTFFVPENASTGMLSVQVGREATSPVSFTIIPNINYLYPASGPVGTAVTVSGTGFAYLPANDTITFNGIVSTVTTGFNGLLATVPHGLPAGSFPVKAKVGGKISPDTHNFNVLPGITSFSPTSGAAGTTVTITGTSFDPAAYNNNVSINGVTAPVVSSTITSITINVPSTASTGKISITVNGQTGNSTSNFIVLPKILSFEPAFGVTGTTVTITGTGFDPVTANNQVAFNGVTATILNSTSTTITAVVPPAATTGVISVLGSNSVSYSSGNFRVDPLITSFSPASGYIGTYVTITGTGFGSINNVTISGSLCSIISITHQSIIFIVPQSATTGAISITQGAITATTPNNFTVLIVPPPVAEPPVNITTDGFTAVWKSVPGVAGYLLDVSTDNFKSYAFGYYSRYEQDTLVNLTGLSTGIGYQYRVRALNVYNISSVYSNTISSVYTGDIITPENKTIYPNPASTVIHIDLPYNTDWTATAIDATGRSYKLNFSQNENVSEFNISNLASGLYVLQLTDGNQMLQYKLVKL